MNRHLDSPFVYALYLGIAVVLGACIGLTEGVKLRSCPATTVDGRPLTAFVLDTNECKYNPLPRPLQNLSSMELRRMAGARERLERIK